MRLGRVWNVDRRCGKISWIRILGGAVSDVRAKVLKSIRDKMFIYILTIFVGESNAKAKVVETAVGWIRLAGRVAYARLLRLSQRCLGVSAALTRQNRDVRVETKRLTNQPIPVEFITTDKTWSAKYEYKQRRHLEDDFAGLLFMDWTSANFMVENIFTLLDCAMVLWFSWPNRYRLFRLVLALVKANVLLHRAFKPWKLLFSFSFSRPTLVRTGNR